MKQLFLLILTVFILSACTSFSEDKGFSIVQQNIYQHLDKKVQWEHHQNDKKMIDDQIAEYLKKPLSVDDTVQIALLNNKGLQANYAELGISEADWVQAGRIRNPFFSFGRLIRGGEIEIEQKLTLPIFSLLAMPLTKKIERRRFEQTQWRVIHEVLRIADEVRRAYFVTVAAQEIVDYTEHIKIAAEAAAELGKRMQAAGNWSELQQAREQEFYVTALAELTRAQQQLTMQRERLIRLLGLSESQHISQLKLLDRLPRLPAVAQKITDTEIQALQNRVDLIIAKQELAGLTDSLGLTKTTRFINILENITYQRNRSNEQAIQQGYEIEFQIPLFDWGGARIARAEAIYTQSVQRLAQLITNIRSEVREAYSDYHAAYHLAKHYRDEILPLKKRISDQQLLRYNGMLISVFDLLTDARAQMYSVIAAIEALRDYWVADATLHAKLLGNTSNNFLIKLPGTTLPANTAD